MCVYVGVLPLLPLRFFLKSPVFLVSFPAVHPTFLASSLQRFCSNKSSLAVNSARPVDVVSWQDSYFVDYFGFLGCSVQTLCYVWFTRFLQRHSKQSGQACASVLCGTDCGCDTRGLVWVGVVLGVLNLLVGVNQNGHWRFWLFRGMLVKSASRIYWRNVYMFYICVWLDFVCVDFTWEMVYIYIYIRGEFWSVRLVMIEFDHPEVILCGWQDIEIQLLTNTVPAELFSGR